MAVSEYDDPRWTPPMATGDTPVFRSVTIGNPGNTGPSPTFPSPMGPVGAEGYGGGGGLPNPFSWLWKHLFPHHTPTAPTTPTTTTQPPKAPSTSQQLLGMAPELLSLLAAFRAQSQANNPANNPALGALNSAVPQLMTQLNSLLQNDVQRRQMSDPLYQAVLRGTMGGLPVWMRGGNPINPPGAPSTTPQG